MSKSPWEIRDAAERGDEDEKSLFSAIGEAITEWEQVEHSCAEIFAIFVSAKGKSIHWDPAIQAYGSITSFAGRCNMLKAASRAYFHRRKKAKAVFEGRFDDLLEECSKFSGRRNEIAHGQVKNVYYSSKRPLSMRRLGYFLIPSLFNPKKHKIGRGITYQYASGDVIHYRQEFTKLHLKLEAFRHDLLGKRPSSRETHP